MGLIILVIAPFIADAERTSTIIVMIDLGIRAEYIERLAIRKH
jgi:hypothetical protein